MFGLDISLTRKRRGAGKLPGCADRVPWVPCLLLACLLSPAPVAAATLDVNLTAAHGGGAGLEVTPGSTCTSPTYELVDAPPTIVGNFEGCDTLTAYGVQVTGPTSFFAGREIRLGSAFSVAPGATLSALINNQMSPFAFVQDDTPDAEATYQATFFVNLNAIFLGLGESVEILRASDQAGNTQFYLALTSAGLVLAARLENGGFTATSPVTLPGSGWMEIQAVWRAGAGDGELKARVNGFQVAALSNLSNVSGRVDSIRLGAIAGETSSTQTIKGSDRFRR